MFNKIKQKRFEREKAKHRLLELQLKYQGVRHIRYTKHGVPLPDWDKMIKEGLERNKTKTNEVS